MGIYYIISAANVKMDQMLKDTFKAFLAQGANFYPVFNSTGNKVLVQVKFPPPINFNTALGFGDKNWLTNTGLNVAEWQTRIYPPDDLVASYFSGSINLGSFLVQVAAIVPV
jgi:hypothetical protein